MSVNVNRSGARKDVWQARPGGDGGPAARDAGGSAWRVGRRTQNVPEAGRLATVTQHRCAIGALSVAFADLDVIAAGQGRGEARLLARARRAAAEH